MVTTNLAVVETYWNLCWNERRVGLLDAVFHDPYTHGRTQFSPALMAELIAETVAGFSDFRVQIDEVHELEDTVITRSTFSGTHDGEVFGLAPSGKQVRMPTLDAFFFEDGKVSKYWHLTDHLPIIQGIGAEVRLGDRLASWE